MSEAEAVFECIRKNIYYKRVVYRLIDEYCPKVKAVCSVSSSIVPDILSEGMERYGDRIVVTHPFNPAHMFPYFQLCASKNTSAGVMDYAVELLKYLP